MAAFYITEQRPDELSKTYEWFNESFKAYSNSFKKVTGVQLKLDKTSVETYKGIHRKLEGQTQTGSESRAKHVNQTSLRSSSTSKEASEYLDLDVVCMLEQLKLNNLKPIFVKEELNIKDIAKLNSENLREIGVHKLKDRIVILDEAKRRIKAAEEKNKDNDGELLLLTTTGPSSEWWGAFGLYKEAGVRQGIKYYQQMDSSNKGFYLYGMIGTNGWNVGDILYSGSGGLLTHVSSITVPSHGWEFYSSEGWVKDKGIKVTHIEDDDMPKILCGVITITLSGDPGKYWSKYAGEFVPTGELTMGKRRYWKISQYCPRWYHLESW